LFSLASCHSTIDLFICPWPLAPEVCIGPNQCVTETTPGTGSLIQHLVAVGIKTFFKLIFFTVHHCVPKRWDVQQC